MIRAAVATALVAAALSACTAGSSSPDSSASATGQPTATTAVCDRVAITEILRTDVDETFPGTTFGALTSLTCTGDWAIARADVDASGTEVEAVFFLRATGSTWEPIPLEELCALPESDVPAEIYAEACEVE